MSFENIPNEIIRHILSHLPLKKQAAIKRVAMMWRFLVNSLEENQLKVIEGTLKEEFPFLEIPKDATPFEKKALLENQQQIDVDLAKEWNLPLQDFKRTSLQCMTQKFNKLSAEEQLAYLEENDVFYLIALIKTSDIFLVLKPFSNPSMEDALDPDFFRYCSLLFCTARLVPRIGNMQYLKHLVKTMPQIDGKMLLNEAAKYNQLACVKCLIEESNTIKQEDIEAALACARDKNHLACITYLEGVLHPPPAPLLFSAPETLPSSMNKDESNNNMEVNNDKNRWRCQIS